MMTNRQIVFFILFSCLFLFYPGNYYYGDLFSYHPDLFSQRTIQKPTQKNPVAYVTNPSNLPFVTATGIYVVDLASFTPVFERNTHMRLFPASTTKMMTALISYNQHPLDEILTVHRVLTEGQVMGLVAGERMTFENMLYGLLVYSGNDAAYALADSDPHGFDSFVLKMNQKAQDLHMADTHFVNPAGLDAVNQYSSVYDLAILGREVLKNEELAKIVSTKSITVSDVDFTHFHELSNVNELLGQIPGVGGLKTGYTEASGQNLVSFYKKNGHNFLIVVLKSEDRFTDTKSIIDWIDTNVSFTPLGGF